MDDDDAEQHTSEYAWEQNFDRTWEKVTVAPDGTLRTGIHQRSWRAEQPEVHENVKRSVMRTLFLLLDCSHHAGDKDAEMHPNRLAVMQSVAADFVAKFFEQNPISSLAVLATRNGKAEMLTEPSCNARQHLAALKQLGESSCKGDASLQNVLELARRGLEPVASFVSREVLLLSASLSTCDPGDIHETIADLKRQRVRCSVCSLLAEVFVLKRLATETGGIFAVATNPPHLRRFAMQLVTPRPTEQASAPSNSLIRIGFPERSAPGAAKELCFGPSGAAKEMQLGEKRYTCPQCHAPHSEIPTVCPICELRLMSSVDLTRTYHHLFPLPVFKETTRDAPQPGAPSFRAGALQGHPAPHLCFGCGDALSLAAEGAVGFACPHCGEAFCASCDEFLHETLHVCPSCQMQRQPPSSGAGAAG